MFLRAPIRFIAALSVTCLLALLAAHAPVTARDKPIAPALWKIDGPQGDVYLFGSFHLLPKGLQWRSPELEAALQASQSLVFEIDLDAAKDVTVMGGLIVKYGLLPPGQSLHKMLAVEYRKKLDDVATTVGLPPAAIDRMRPWLAALTLTSLSFVKQNTKAGERIDPSKITDELGGVDLQLWSWAKAAGKERVALETAESQIRIFADLSHEQEVQYLIMTLNQIDKMPAAIDVLLQAWKTGDTATLDKSMNSDMDAFPTMRKLLFEDRHAKWLPQIEAMMADGKTHVVVVGAAHLVGKGSVVDLLRAKGVRVEGP
jgi:uncharacterized protein YbaP (TraB family)